MLVFGAACAASPQKTLNLKVMIKSAATAASLMTKMQSRASSRLDHDIEVSHRPWI